MAKRTYFCYQCESEFTVVSKIEEIQYCPYCAADIEDADKDDVEED